MTVDVSSLSAPDAIVALRSFPRRYREALEPAPGEEIEEIAAHLRADGRSILAEVIGVERAYVVLTRAIEQVVHADEPVLHAGVLDPSARDYSGDDEGTLDAHLDELSDVATRLAEVASRVPADDWQRAATLPGGGRTTAVELLREAVRTGADVLRSIQQDLAVRRGR